MTNLEHHAAICKELGDIYQRKNHDYGDSFHKSFQEYGIMIALGRMDDKMSRVKSLVKNGGAKVTDESIQDTLLDLANYAIMTVMELGHEAEKD